MAAAGVDALPPLRTVIRRHGITARRGLGQHFLLDLNLTARIARAAGDLSGTNAIEIGAGPGGLTRALLATDARHVYAVERDSRCVAALVELAAAYPGRLSVIEADALEIDLPRLVPAPRRIVANLPYNISTALLGNWLGEIRAYDGLTLMFQREVAERLAAQPGGKSYGRLTVAVQWLCRVRILFDVPPKVFTPPPKVRSSVVAIEPREAPLAPASGATLERVTRAAFGQRRKMLRSSLATLGVDTVKLIEMAGLRPTARAEELSVVEFAALARALTALEAAQG